MAELSEIADWALRTLTGMPGTSSIVHSDLVHAVIGEARGDHDVLAELVDAGRAVRLDEAHYELDVVMQPASDDPTGYGIVVMWHAIYAARADKAIQPGGMRLSFVYDRATHPLESPAAAVNWFRDNETRLLQMLNGAVEYGFDDVACELAEPMWSLARYLGHNTTEVVTQFQTIQLLDKFEDDQREHRRATALARAACGLSNMEMHVQAIDYADNAVVSATSLGDLQVLSTALSARGRAHELAGDPRTALENYEAALDLAKQIGNPRRIALLHRRVGVIRALLDDPDSAIAHLRTAEKLIGDPVGRARVLTYLAKVLVDDGQHAKAYATIEPVFEVLKTTANDLYIAEAASVAAASAEHTNPAVARAHYFLALTKFEAHGLPKRAAEIQRQLDQLNDRADR